MHHVSQGSQGVGSCSASSRIPTFWGLQNPHILQLQGCFIEGFGAGTGFYPWTQET